MTVYFPACNFSRMHGVDRLLRRSFTQTQRIEVGYVGRVGLLPSGRIRGQHGDGDFRQSLRVPVAQAARIEDALDRFGTGENARGGEFVLLRNLDNLLYAVCAKLGSDGRSLGEIAARKLCGADAPFGKRKVRAAGSFATVGHRQQIRIRMLHPGQCFRGFHHAPQALVVKLISRGAGRASAESGAHRDDMIFFLDVLMDDVVGKTSKRKPSAGKENLDFVSTR